jgi:hypothetical protein
MWAFGLRAFGWDNPQRLLVIDLGPSSQARLSAARGRKVYSRDFMDAYRDRQHHVLERDAGIEDRARLAPENLEAD